MKKTMILVLLILCSILVEGLRTCQDINEPFSPCEIITPVINCNTYDLYNSTHTLRIDNGAMTQIGTTGTYYFTFSLNDSGTHKLILCDNTTGTIEVASYSNKVIYDNNLANSSSVRSDISTTQTGVQSNQTKVSGNISTVRSELATAQADLDNPNQYKADVSTLATASQLTDNVSNLQTYGDSNWATATGFSTTTQANAILTGVKTNISYLEGNISSTRARGDSAWITATNFASLVNATTIVNLINALNDLASSDIWTYATRTLTSFAGVWNETGRTIINDTSTILTQLNVNTSTVLSSLDTQCISETELNLSHSTGNYSDIGETGSVSISSSDIATIANETFKKLIQNKTEIYFNNSLGYPTYEVWNYKPDEITVNKSYGYYPGNLTIKNATFKRTP